MARCPQCGVTVPISQAWGAALRPRLMLPFDDFGVRCEKCGTPLLVLKKRAILMSVALIVGGSALAAYLYARASDPTDPGSGAFVFFISVLGLAILQAWLAPHLCDVRRLKENETVRFPLEEDV